MYIICISTYFQSYEILGYILFILEELGVANVPTLNSIKMFNFSPDLTIDDAVLQVLMTLLNLYIPQNY